MTLPPSTGLISLRSLFPAATFLNCSDIEVREVTSDSRHISRGCLFAAFPGKKTDGRDFVPEALRSGAAAILTHRSLAGLPVPQCIVPDARRAYGEVCHALHFNPSLSLGMVGVTGTNGKTTTTWLVRALLQQLARTCGLLGTIEYHNGHDSQPANLTTPGAPTLAQWLGSMVARQTGYAALELSSHALDQDRPAGLSLDVAVITNITHDHLDYHQHTEHYAAAKARIVEYLKPGGRLIINADDPGCQRLLLRLDIQQADTLTFGLKSPASLRAKIVDESLDGTVFHLKSETESLEIHTQLIGTHNIENILAAIASVRHFGFSLSEIGAALPHCAAPPGRLQRVPSRNEAHVFIDYAHTPDALTRVVETVRPLCFGRVILVFGAGGDRDASKRPLMGHAASAADVVVITSDNPRTEDPEVIAKQITDGLRQAATDSENPHILQFPGTTIEKRLIVELDRHMAIERAIKLAEPGDVVLIAGKGHEREQLIGRHRFPFDDAAVAEAALRRVSVPLEFSRCEQG